MWQFVMLFSLTFLFTLLSYIYPYKPQYIKEQEESSKYIVLIYIIRFFHYCTFFFSIIYPYIFNDKYDIYYLSFGVFLYIHWKLIKNECILSLWEKQLMDNMYIIGSNIEYHPFIDSISHNLNRFMVNMMFISFGIVLLRFLIQNVFHKVYSLIFKIICSAKNLAYSPFEFPINLKFKGIFIAKEFI